MKRLFIGGTADGQWVETDGSPYWRVALPIEPCTSAAEVPVAMDYAVQFDEYHLAQITDECSIYTLKGLSPEDVCTKLVENYKPKEGMDEVEELYMRSASDWLGFQIQVPEHVRRMAQHAIRFFLKNHIRKP
jgi:hypothetical protein